MQNYRKKEIRREADIFREKCNISRYGVANLFKECERLDYKLLRYPLDEGGDLGFAIKKDKDIVIFTNTSSRLSREIFTLAHELGHVVLHMEESASFVDDSMSISGNCLDDKEEEANYFAACLLMPFDEVAKFLDYELDDVEAKKLSALDLARMMSEFNVSFEMALNRLENLGIIDSYTKIRLESEKVEARVGNLLRTVGGNSKLNEPCKVTEIPYEYIGYVIYNYNHKAIPLETLERVLECYHLTLDDIRDELINYYENEDDLDELIGGLID